MNELTKQYFIDNGCKIENARITSVDISMADHDCITFNLGLDGEGWGINFGGYCLGHGYLGADESFFDGSPSGIKAIGLVMNTVGVDKFFSLKDKYVRVAISGNGFGEVRAIGNIISDKWFEYKLFFEKEKAQDIAKSK